MKKGKVRLLPKIQDVNNCSLKYLPKVQVSMLPSYIEEKKEPKEISKKDLQKNELSNCHR